MQWNNNSLSEQFCSLRSQTSDQLKAYNQFWKSYNHTYDCANDYDNGDVDELKLMLQFCFRKSQAWSPQHYPVQDITG